MGEDLGGLSTLPASVNFSVLFSLLLAMGDWYPLYSQPNQTNQSRGFDQSYPIQQAAQDAVSHFNVSGPKGAADIEEATWFPFSW